MKDIYRSSAFLAGGEANSDCHAGHGALTPSPILLSNGTSSQSELGAAQQHSGCNLQVTMPGCRCRHHLLTEPCNGHGSCVEDHQPCSSGVQLTSQQLPQHQLCREMNPSSYIAIASLM